MRSASTPSGSSWARCSAWRARGSSWRLETGFKLAFVLKEERDDLPGALECLDRILEWEATFPAAVRFLETLQRETGADETLPDGRSVQLVVSELLARGYTDDTEWQRWLSVYELRLEHAPSAEERFEALVAAGQLLVRHRQATDRAVDYYARALRIHPERDELAASLVQAGQLAGLERQVRDALEEAATLPGAPKAKFYLRAAELSELHLHDAEATARLYEAVLAEDPESPEALQALERFHAGRGDTAALVDVLHHRVDRAETDEERAALWGRLGGLLEEEDRPEDAASAYAKSLEADEEQLSVVDRLESLYHRLARWEELAELLQWHMGRVSDDDARVDLLTRLASIQERNLERLDEAVLCYSELFELMPNSLYAIAGLERLCPKVGAWDTLVSVLERKRDILASPRDRLRVDYQIGSVYHRELQRIPEALDFYRMVLARDEKHAETVHALEELFTDERYRFSVSLMLENVYEETEDWEKLAALHEAQLPFVGEAGERLDLCIRAADLWESRVGRPEEGLRVLAGALRDGGNHEVARTRMEQIATRHRAWDALVSAVSLLLPDLSDSDEVRRLQLWIAEIQDRNVGDRDGAIARLMDLVRGGDRSGRALDLLEKLLETDGRWEDLYLLLAEQVAEAPTGERQALRLRLAQIAHERMEDPEEALRWLKEAFWEDSTNQAVQEHLQRIAEVEPGHRGEVLELLLPLYRRDERWAELAALLDLQFSATTEPARRGELALQSAEIYAGHLEEPGRAIERYMAALRDDPMAMAGRLDTADELASQSGQLEAWAHALEEGSHVTLDATQRVDLLLRAGRVYLERLGKPDRAEKMFQELLREDPTRVDVLDVLEDLYRSTGRHGDLIWVCEQKARLSLSLEERKRIFYTLGDSARLRRDVDLAIDAYEQILALDPSEARALRQLEGLFEQRRDYDRLTEILERQAQVATAAGENVLTLKLRLARIREEELQDHEGAIEALEEVVALEPTHVEALRSLERLFVETNDWERLRDVLERQLEAAESEGGEIELLRRLAQLSENELDDTDTAVEAYERILGKVPDDSVARDELIRLLHKNGRWDELVELYERKIATVPSATERARLMVKAADITNRELGDPMRATEMLEEVLTQQPDHSAALLALASIHEGQGNWWEARAILERLLPLLGSSRERIDVLVRLGRLYFENGDELRPALRYLLEAVEAERDHRGANELLRRIYEARGSWEALLHILQRQLEWTHEPSERAAKCREIAILYRDRLKRAGDFLQWMEEAYALDPHDEDTVRALVEAYAMRGDAEALLGPLRWLVEHLEARRQYDTLPPYAHRLGQVLEELGDVDGALHYYRLAYRHDATYLPNLLSQGRLLLRLERFPHPPADDRRRRRADDGLARGDAQHGRPTSARRRCSSRATAARW